MLSKEEIDFRVQRAKDLFAEGYNCCQSVFGACSDLFGLSDADLAFRLSSSFGGGMGRMRKTCGAVCGMFLLEGLHSGGKLPEYDKKVNYARVQSLSRSFEERFGSTTCADLLGVAKRDVVSDSVPEPRTEAYYKKRPCVELVGEATRIFLNSL